MARMSPSNPCNSTPFWEDGRQHPSTSPPPQLFLRFPAPTRRGRGLKLLALSRQNGSVELWAARLDIKQQWGGHLGLWRDGCAEHAIYSPFWEGQHS